MDLLVMNDMIQQAALAILLFVSALIAFIAIRVDRRALHSKNYYHLTIFLAAGGHTGQMCQLFKGFDFHKVSKISILTASSDRSSVNFWEKGLETQLTPEEINDLREKTRYYSLARTNEVKQSYVWAILPTIRSILQAGWLIIAALLSTTHFVSTGPGTCVPLFYIFYLLKKLRMSRVRLMFFESWCRVEDLSLSGKLVRPIVDDFVVHWPELAEKYKKVRYLGQII